MKLLLINYPLQAKNKTVQNTRHKRTSKSVVLFRTKTATCGFGTTGEGGYQYDGKEFTQFTEKDGLSDNSVWSIIKG